MVGAFAEHPTCSFFSHDKGARFAAHQVSVLNPMVDELNEHLRTAIAQLSNAGARVRTLEQEIIEN